MITVLGSYNKDIYIMIDHFPLSGETVFIKDIKYFHGGKGSNQAVSVRRLGISTAFLGAVGDDQFGMEALEFWKEEGVIVDNVKIKKGASTGTAYIILNQNGESQILVNRGANALLSIDDVKDALKGDILLTQLEINEEVVKYSLRSFEGLKILNPAPANLIDPEIFSYVDILTPNEIEIHEIIQNDDIVGGAQSLLNKVKKAVIITLGERGALIVLRDRTIHIEAPKVPVVDETGAGDVFNAALAVYLIKGYSIEEATKLAVYIASFSVTKMGALGPKIDEVRPFLEEKGLI